MECYWSWSSRSRWVVSRRHVHRTKTSYPYIQWWMCDICSWAIHHFHRWLSYLSSSISLSQSWTGKNRFGNDHRILQIRTCCLHIRQPNENDGVSVSLHSIAPAAPPLAMSYCRLSIRRNHSLCWIRHILQRCKSIDYGQLYKWWAIY